MEILIPQHISKYGCLSVSICTIPNCIITYMYGYNTLCILHVVVLITSLLHWHKIRDGWFRKIDKSVALMTMYRVTFIERYHLHPTYQTYWMYVGSIMAASFVVNELTFLQVDTFTNRERACYYSVGNHILFIHILPTVTLNTFIILSDIKLK